MGAAPVLWNLIGAVKVRVQGPNPARLLNLCVSRGIPVSGIREEDGALVFYTLPWRYRELRPLAFKSRCRPQVIGRSGLWFLWSKVRKRQVLVASILVLCGVLYYLSGSIWVVDVRGNSRVSKERILGAAVKAGLYRGARKALICTEFVDAIISGDIPELGWVYTSIHGTVAVIEVREKVEHPVDRPGDMVARRDGLVKSVLVLSGNPLVKAGDTVKAGDILIAGDPSVPSGTARGEVVASTWYKASVEVPLREVQPRRTGRRVEVRLLNLRGNLIPLFGSRTVPFRWYEVEDSVAGGGKEPETAISIITRTYYELAWVEAERSPAEARDLARKRLEDIVRRQLPPSVKLIDFSVEVKIAPDQGVVVATGLAQAEENIAVLKPWPQ
ncbi:MAG: sporulation protein YqfD [Firmicutes bacterium]|nr:sporulation protein YqfD [Candidatus Fermentithermobacillaceae bacterium]